MHRINHEARINHDLSAEGRAGCVMILTFMP
jgi:hypothetical protein